MVPPSSTACIDFASLVVDDEIALEGDQCFKITIGDSMANVTILDDDGEFLDTHTSTAFSDSLRCYVYSLQGFF